MPTVKVPVEPDHDSPFYVPKPMTFTYNTEIDYVREVFMPLSTLLIPIAFMLGVYIGMAM